MKKTTTPYYYDLTTGNDSADYYPINSTSMPPGAELIIIGGNTSHALLDYNSNHTLCDFTHILYTTQYPTLSRFLLYFCLLCIVIIVLLNALVLVVLTVYWPAVRRLRSSSSMRPAREAAGRAQQELYIANLAFCDFFIGLFLFPLWLLETIVYGCWTFPQWACRWRKILSWVLGFESGITVGLIALDRFMMVRLGPMYSQHESQTRVCLKILCSWLIDIAFFVPLSYYDHLVSGITLSINGFCISEFFQHRQLFWSVYYVYYCVPVTLCIGTYIAIFCILNFRRRQEAAKAASVRINNRHSSSANVLALPESIVLVENNNVLRSSSTTTRHHKHIDDPFKRRYRKAWITMIYLNIVFAMWWIPYGIVSVVELIMDTSFVSHDIKLGIEIIFFLNSLLNPCIYLTTIPSLRLAVLKIIKRLVCCQWAALLLSTPRERASMMMSEAHPSCVVVHEEDNGHSAMNRHRVSNGAGVFEVDACNAEDEEEKEGVVVITKTPPTNDADEDDKHCRQQPPSRPNRCNTMPSNNTFYQRKKRTKTSRRASCSSNNNKFLTVVTTTLYAAAAAKAVGDMVGHTSSSSNSGSQTSTSAADMNPSPMSSSVLNTTAAANGNVMPERLQTTTNDDNKITRSRQRSGSLPLHNNNNNGYTATSVL